MNLVQPIRDRETLDHVKAYLKESNERNYIMFLLGINTGLRISDILKLRVGDVRGTHIILREEKTDKTNRIQINPTLRKGLRPYLDGRKHDEYLIVSRQRDKNGRQRPISRSMAYKVLKKAAKEFGLNEIGCHTMRKSFGYHLYEQTRNGKLVQKMLNHSTEEYTMLYIGLTQDYLDDALNKLRL